MSGAIKEKTPRRWQWTNYFSLRIVLIVQMVMDVDIMDVNASAGT